MSDQKSILTQIVKAQEAFQQTTQKYAETDTTDILLRADTAIKEAVGQGYFGAQIGGIMDHFVAEKAAIQLSELGYATVVNQSGVAPIEGGAPGATRPVLVINLSWKYMPQNTRDAWTV